MSAVHSLLAEARRHDVAITLNGDRLALEAPKAPPHEFIERLRTCKPDIIASLRSLPTPGVKGWRQGVCRMYTSNPPADCSPQRWLDLCESAGSFLDDWGEHAYALGWTTIDLFGVHPCSPLGRYDCMGLVVFLPGVHLAALTDSTATLNRDRGHATTFYRRQRLHPEAMPLWTLCGPRS